MIEFAEIKIGEGPVAVCSRCGRPTSPPQPYELQRISASLAAVSGGLPGTTANVMLCGFEPFDHPQLPAVIGSAAQSGFNRIALRTDAGALTVPANAAGVISAGVRHVEVVLMGDETTHDSLVGREGSFTAAATGCQAFLRAGRAESEHVVVSALVKACRHNLNALGGAVAGASKAGSVAVRIDASSLTVHDADIVLAALETAAMSMMAGYVVGAPFEVPRPFGEQPWLYRPEPVALTGGEVR